MRQRPPASRTGRFLRVLVVAGGGHYGTEVMHGFIAQAREHHRWFIRIVTAEPSLLRDAVAWDAHGIILVCPDLPLLESFAGLGRPLVNTGQKSPHLQVPGVGNDDTAIGQLAADHLLTRGFRHFALVGSATGSADTGREAGFLAAIAERGYECRQFSAARPGKRTSWRGQDVQLATWLRSLPRPTAVFATNDGWAWRIAEGAHGLGLRVPEDLAILGVNDDESYCTTAQPALSSIALQSRRVGREAADLLAHLMAGRPGGWPMRLLPPLRVVERHSTDIVLISDPVVGAALNHIRHHLQEGSMVTDVASELGLSRRALERRFQAALGRSPLEEIHRQRIARAQGMLAEGLTVAAVATACGFNDRQSFRTTFRRHAGMTPSDYRRTYGHR